MTPWQGAKFAEIRMRCEHSFEVPRQGMRSRRCSRCGTWEAPATWDSLCPDGADDEKLFLISLVEELDRQLARTGAVAKSEGK